MNSQCRIYLLIPIFIAALAPMIWGSTYIVTSELLPDDMPFTAAVVRCIPAGVILLIMGNIQVRMSGIQFLHLTLLGLLNIGLFQACLFIAAYRLPGGIAAVIGAIQPLLILLMIWLAEQTKPAISSLLACVAAVAGMSALVLSPDAQWDTYGGLAAFIGAASMALGTYLGQRWRSDMPLLPFTGWQLLLGGVMLLPASIWVDPDLPSLTTVQYAAFAYLCLFGALLAYTLWFYGLGKLPPAAMASLGLLSPLSAGTLGWVFLDQQITGWGLLGLVTVLLSIFIVQISNTNSKVHKNNSASAQPATSTSESYL